MAADRFGKLLRTASAKAKEAAAVVREEYVKGTEGDDSPTQVIFGASGYDQLKAILRRSGEPRVAEEVPPDNGPDLDDLDDEAAAVEVSDVLQRIDWKSVSATAHERSGDVAERMKSLAGDVDWERMKPVAGKVASALVAAAATGQIGRLSGPTAVAISRAMKSNNVGEAAAALVVRRGPAGIVAGEVMKTFLKPPRPGEIPLPAPPTLANRTNIFEAHLADLHQATE